MASDSLLESVGDSSSEVLAANMHKSSATAPSPFLSMLGKNHISHQKVVDGYLTHWERVRGGEAEDTEEARKDRENQYSSLVNG